MMRPGAGQNYPRSGFPLEGKAAPGLLPLGKVPGGRDKASPSRSRQSRAVRAGGAGAELCPRTGRAGAAATNAQTAGWRFWPRTQGAGRSLWPAGAGGTGRESGGAAGPDPTLQQSEEQ